MPVMRTLMQDYQAEVIATAEVHPKVRTKYATALNRYQDLVGDKQPADVHWHDVRDYIVRLRDGHWGHPCQGESILTALAPISQFHIWLEDEGLSTGNPVPAAKRHTLRGGIKKRRVKRRLLRPAEVAQILNNCTDPLSFTAALLLSKTAIRCDELCSLDVTDITFTGPNWGRLMVKERPKRTNCQLWLDEETLRVLRWYIDKERVTPHTDDPLFVQACGNRLTEKVLNRVLLREAAAPIVRNVYDPLDRVTSHCFRHFWTTYMRAKTRDSMMINEYRGDEDSTILDTYTNLQDGLLLRQWYRRHIWTLNEIQQDLQDGRLGFPSLEDILATPSRPPRPSTVHSPSGH